MAAVVPVAGPEGLSTAGSAARLGLSPEGPFGHQAPSPSYEGGGVYGGFSPSDLRSAYNLPESGGAGLTVAVTIAYDNPKAESDLAAYRNYYGLPSCTGASGCFKKVNQYGETGNYPAGDEGWALETSLDLDMVSATCPQCHILLVEATTPNYEDMAAAVEKAAQLGADVISNSWASEEFPEETLEDQHFNHPGIPTLFASGDWGYGVEYPAASPYAIAVGGTSLKPAGTTRGWSESAWGGAGSGCSQYEPKPAWQTDTGCAMRAVADVSAVADTQTPVSVYDSYGLPGWSLLGGTSVATPVVAGIEALSSSAFRAAGPSAFWRAGYGTGFFDVTDGENGPCARESSNGFAATYLCQGTIGYDGPTGWGTPNGPFSLPVAVTEEATVSAGKATLHGSVNPNGLPTEYLFEYGETTAYGSAVPVPHGSAGSGSDYVSLTETIEGLKPETTYHYRITAVNSGTFHGVDRTFGITPPSATTGPATEVRSTAAKVKGTVNPRGLRTTYYFEYGPNTSYGHKAPARAGELIGGTSNQNVSAEFTDLEGNTPYHYRLVARNIAGTTYGLDGTLLTERAQWVVADMPQPPNSGNGEEAFDVSCLPSEKCVSVGSNWSLDLHASATLAEWWDGSEWEPMTTPNPPGLEEGWEHQRYATLRGVSCLPEGSSKGSCVAVGYYKGTSELVKPVAERWDGSNWSMMEPVMPAGSEAAALQAVSCTAADDCRAAGAFVSSAGVVESMVERWDGIEWTIEATPNPSDAKETRLYGISCPSASSCVAVGYDGTVTNAEETFAIHWDGSEWTQRETPNPGERSVAEMWNVSCASATACVAVGAYQKGPTLVTLAEHWNGTSWSVKSTPTPHEEGGLTGVSCTTATNCTASGYYYNPTEVDHGWRPIIERWSGGSWSVLEIAAWPVPAGWWHESFLSGVACVEPEACNAVGSHLEAPEGQFASMHAFSEHEETPPFPEFTSAPQAPLTEETVTFDGSATLDPGHAIASYEWDFGDGATGSGQKPSHAYPHTGTYVVKLTATDDIGRTGAVSRLLYVGDRPPTASFAVETPSPTGASPVLFDGSASSDVDGTIVSYLWSFGDGTAGLGPKPSHVYAHPGEYTVTLTVVDNDGSSGQTSQSLSVANSHPNALFSINAQSPVAAQPIGFDGSASVDPDGSVASYSWDFGDGTAGTGAKPTHSYAHAGDYTVTLTATDNEGLTAQVTHVVSVGNAAPAAAFSVSPAPTAGRPVGFDAAGSADPDGSIVAYKWDFGDGAAGGGRSAQHEYSRAGVYPVALMIVDDSGLTATAHRFVNVAAPSGQFRLRAIDHDVKTGVVSVTLWMPGPGSLSARDLADALHRKGSPAARVKPVSQRVQRSGRMELRLVPTRATLEALGRGRRMRVNVLIRFTPDFGTSVVRMREVPFYLAPPPAADSPPHRRR